MLEKFEIVVSIFHGFDYPSILKAEPAKSIAGIAAAMARWNDRKRRLFKPVHIRLAWERLQVEGWVKV